MTVFILAIVEAVRKAFFDGTDSNISKKNESLPAVIASQAAGEGAEAGTLPIPPRADRLNCLRPDFLVCSLPPRAP